MGISEILRRSAQNLFLQSFDDLEVRIFGDADGYFAEMPLLDSKVSCKLPDLPVEALLEEDDPRKYGTMLFEWLFRDNLKDAFIAVRRVSQLSTRSGTATAIAGPTRDIRLRLWLDPGAPALHCVWWEALQEPYRPEPLSLHAAFSRFVRVSTARGWPISERPLRGLWVAANPKGLEEDGLSGIDVDLEQSIIGQATRPLAELLTWENLIGTISLDDIRRKVGENYHIVHLLAPIAMADDHEVIVLSGDSGQAQMVSFKELAEVIGNGSNQAPYFVFLSTSLAADKKAREGLVKFASLLIEKGVQAVVTIQAALTKEELAGFVQVFYEGLIRTGVIDVATMQARAWLYDISIQNPDTQWHWAHPVLHMRTPDAQLFQSLPEASESRVQDILANIKQSKL